MVTGPTSQEDEIYSIMFSSLKHPVRRKILRMLGTKPMTFMDMVDQLGVSSSHLTYHLDNLGELVTKLEDGQYKLSAFGQATVSAMKDVEDVREAEPKRQKVTSKWKTVSAVLLIAVILVSSIAVVEFGLYSQLSGEKNSLELENKRLLSYGIGAGKVANFLENVTKIDVASYTVSVPRDTIQPRPDYGGVIEELLQGSLTGSLSNLNFEIRFRNNHFFRYKLDMFESLPVFTQSQPTDVLQNAKYTLARYKAYAGDQYLTNMSNLLNSMGTLNSTVIIQGNIKLETAIQGNEVTFLLMHTEGDIDFQTKGVKMVFQGNILTYLEDGYYLFTVGSTQLTMKDPVPVIEMAKNHVKTLTRTIDGQQVSGFTTVDEPIAVQLVPHTRGNSVALYPYWYMRFALAQTYSGGINEIAVGIWGDTGEIADVQLLADSTEVIGQ